MTGSAAHLSLQHVSGPEFSSVVPVLLDVYAEVYATVLTGIAAALLGVALTAVRGLDIR